MNGANQHRLNSNRGNSVTVRTRHLVSRLGFVKVNVNVRNAVVTVFVDVTVSEHLAAEAFTVCQPRTYFNPADNQAQTLLTTALLALVRDVVPAVDAAAG